MPEGRDGRSAGPSHGGHRANEGGSCDAGPTGRRRSGGLDVPGTWNRASVQSMLMLVSAIGVIVLLGGVASYVGVVPALDVDGDADDDGLADERERALGTDPYDPDTDGDRLQDGWEARNRTDEGARLPDADPLHKDLYVQVNYGREIMALTDREKADLRRQFASMAVANPDGSDGIDVHVVDEAPRGGEFDRNVLVEGERSRQTLANEFYNAETLGDRKCVFHLVVMAVVQDGDTAGYGDSPGYLAIVDGADIGRYGGDVTARVRYVVHELLHNVVGRFDDGTYHTDDGWLTHSAALAGQNEHLSDDTRRHLDEEGFSENDYYQGRTCD